MNRMVSKPSEEEEGKELLRVNTHRVTMIHAIIIYYCQQEKEEGEGNGASRLWCEVITINGALDKAPSLSETIVSMPNARGQHAAELTSHYSCIVQCC